MDYKKHIAEKLASCGIDKEEIEAAIAVPPDNKMGDYALPCFKFAKVMRKSPVAIAEELKNMFATDDAISEVEAVNGYLNFRVNRTVLVKETLEKIAASETGVAVANVYSVQRSLLKRKKIEDMLGDNVNHPSDYMARIYTQVILDTLFGEKTGE